VKQDYFSPEDIACLLGIATYTVRELVRRGRIRHVRAGRMIRIKREWAEDYYRTLTNEPRR
jgi:excisionase family DNA binding protein